MLRARRSRTRASAADPLLALARDRAFARSFLIRRADRLLFGSDYPFMPDWHTAENVDGFAGHPGWTDEQRSRVASGNALDLFPTLRARIVT